MILSKLKLDEEHELEFSMQVFGTKESASDIRFVVRAPDYDVVFHGERLNESVKVRIPKLKGILPSGIHDCSMEIIIDGKVFSPLTESIEFEPLVELDVKPQSKTMLREEVKVSKIAVKAKPEPKTSIDIALSEGFELIEYANGAFAMKRGEKFYGFVSEDRILRSATAHDTVESLVKDLYVA